MNYFEEIQKRATLNNLMSYLLTGTDTDEEVTETKDELLDKAYDDLFAQLETMFPGASRDNNRLYNAVVDFAIVHQDIFFESGVLTGVQLYRNLNQDHPF